MRLRLPFFFPAIAIAILGTSMPGQQHPAKPSVEDKPLPGISALMLQVQAHQRQLDKVREDYTYHDFEQTDDLDSNGQVKKTETEEYEVFFVNSHHIQRLVKKNGKDLSSDEAKKEQDRVTNEVEKATKVEPGKSVEHGGITISRILEIMKASNPRRVSLNGRDTIAFDFVGDPHAQTHGVAEDASKKISGTMWVDEKDVQVAKLTVRFDDNFRIGGGLVASVQKGSSLVFEQALVNNELWLPTSAEIHLAAREFVFKSYRQTMHFKDTDYQRFHTDASQQSGATVLPNQ